MARKRVISPEFYTSETMALLPVATRYTYIGLWLYLDDEGRGKDNAALVKASVWPLDESYTSRKVAADLDRLEKLGTVCRYEHCGRQFLHIPEWSKWQKISHPTPSLACPCPIHETDAAHPAPEPLRSRSGKSPRNVIQVNSTQCSSNASDGPPLPHQDIDNELPMIGILRSRLAARGMLASWAKVTDAEKLEVCELIVKHGGDGPLLDAAQRQHRANDPAVYASAWFQTWREMPTAEERLRVVQVDQCELHSQPAHSCGGCRADRLAVGD